jgi:exopolysaccharide biosynthesis polyprenyl glycosylphosphotransferase
MSQVSPTTRDTLGSVSEAAEGIGMRRFRPEELPVATPARAEIEQTRNRWWRDQLRRRMLVTADLLVAIAIGVAVTASLDQSVLLALVAIPPSLLSAKLLGLYDADHRAIRHLTVDEVPRLAAWVGIATIATALLMPIGLKVGPIVLIMAGATFMSFVARAVVRIAWRRLTPPERTLVIGNGEPAEAIARKVQIFDDMHLRLAAGPCPTTITSSNGHDPLDHLLEGIDRVVVAWGEVDGQLVERLLEQCRRREVKLSVVSPFRGRARPAAGLSQIADLPVLEYNTWDVPRSTMIMKRTFDLAVSAVLLTLLMPVLIAIAIAIKLDDRGAVLFTQLRAGRDGKPFRMLKFRSMVVDAEDRLSTLVNLDELTDPMFKLREDPRVTRVGRFLRRYSLDELPQLFNVFKGEMSLVGPRPEEVLVVERYAPEHRFRLELTPGLTGPMQVFGRGELTFKERLALELDYLEHLSVLRDLHLMALTIPAVIKGRGAY